MRANLARRLPLGAGVISKNVRVGFIPKSVGAGFIPARKRVSRNPFLYVPQFPLRQNLQKAIQPGNKGTPLHLFEIAWCLDHLESQGSSDSSLEIL